MCLRECGQVAEAEWSSVNAEGPPDQEEPSQCHDASVCVRGRLAGMEGQCHPPQSLLPWPRFHAAAFDVVLD